MKTKLSGLVRLFRFELPFTAGVCVILGELLALGKLPSVSEMVFGFLSVFLLAATSLILNDYFDMESDKINAPERPLPAGLVTKQDVLLLSVTVTALGFVTSLLLGFQALLAGIVVWAVGFLYNWRFKKTGLPGNLMVSFSVGMTFIFGGIAVARPFEKVVWLFAIVVALINLGEEIAADAMDADGDRQAGSRSLALLFGSEKALKVSGMLFVFAIAITSLFFLFGWLEWIYALPILFMDGMILYATLKLLDTRTANRRLYIRWIYLSGMAALLVFVIIRMMR